jgi:hypothetical protein
MHSQYTNPSAAHRDGSPYRLRSRRMHRAKQVGRTVSVSRRVYWSDKASTFALWATADRRDKVRDNVFPEP